MICMFQLAWLWIGGKTVGQLDTTSPFFTNSYTISHVILHSWNFITIFYCNNITQTFFLHTHPPGIISWHFVLTSAPALIKALTGEHVLGWIALSSWRHLGSCSVDWDWKWYSVSELGSHTLLMSCYNEMQPIKIILPQMLSVFSREHEISTVSYIHWRGVPQGPGRGRRPRPGSLRYTPTVNVGKLFSHAPRMAQITAAVTAAAAAAVVSFRYFPPGREIPVWIFPLGNSRGSTGKSTLDGDHLFVCR